MTTLLSVDALTVSYGVREPVLHDVSLALEPGQALGVVGMNGAGKSTLLSAIAGAINPRSGSIRLKDRELSGMGTADRARAGIVRLAEGHRVLAPLTVRENLEIACMTLSARRVQRRLDDVLPFVHSLFPILREREAQPAGLLSGGEQQMLSIARAIVQQPAVLLLDEPSLGLAPIVIDRIYEALGPLQERGMGLLIVEQNSDRVARACHELLILRDGRVVDRGAPGEFDSARMHAGYFGTGPSQVQRAQVMSERHVSGKSAEREQL